MWWIKCRRLFTRNRSKLLLSSQVGIDFVLKKCKHFQYFRWACMATTFRRAEMEQKRDDEGSTWSTKACLLELLCLLPVMVS
jgi:hypothetical protein